MISSQHQRDSSLTENLTYFLGQPRAGLRNLVEKFQVGLAEGASFRNGDRQVSAVDDLVSELSQGVMEPCDTHGTGSHIDAPSSCPQIQGDS